MVSISNLTQFQSTQQRCPSFQSPRKVSSSTLMAKTDRKATMYAGCCAEMVGLFWYSQIKSRSHLDLQDFMIGLCLWVPSIERLQANKIEGFSKMFFTLQAVILWLRLFYTQCQFQNLCGRLGQATRHQVKYADIARWRWISTKNRFPKFFKFQLVNWNPLEPFAI